MNVKLNLVAIKKDSKVFVKAKDKYDCNFERIKFRFDAEELESFNKDWKVFSSVPKTAEQFLKGDRAVIKYQLKEGFTPTDKTPSSMTRAAFMCCDDECENSEIRGLYDPVYKQEQDKWVFVDMKIEVLDSDCEPLINPKYQYKVKFPEYITTHMIVRHKMPCYMEGDELYDLIRSAVKKNIPKHCIIKSDYAFHFEVKIVVPYITNPLIKETKSIIEISKKKYQYSGKIKDVHADNYAELEKKIDKIIQGYIDKMKTKVYVCPECGGRGWVEQE